MGEPQDKFDEINQLIIEMASGDFDARLPISNESDEWDAIITGINMLGEELKHTTVSKDYLNMIYKGVVDMLIILNADHTIQSTNDFVPQIFRCEKEDLIGKPFSVLLSNPDPEALKNFQDELFKKGFNYNLELNFVTARNQIIPVSCSASILYDNNKELTGILYIAKDISKQKKTEEDLIAKNKELDTFLYRAAHDLKSPVTSIMGITNIANMEVEDSAATKYFKMIRECADKLDKILLKLRETIISEKINKEAESIDFKILIYKVLQEIRDKTNYNEADVRVNIEISLKENFLSNYHTIHSIFYNIIDNSIKYKKSQSVCYINISIKETEDGIDVNIRDNGIGIKKEFQGRVFDMFFKATTLSDGTGLGLYVVNNQIKSLNGKITLISEENAGTEVQIYIPSAIVKPPL